MKREEKLERRLIRNEEKKHAGLETEGNEGDAPTEGENDTDAPRAETERE